MKNISNNYLSVLQWESFSQQIANCINNMPIRRGYRKKIEGGFTWRPPTVKLAQNN